MIEKRCLQCGKTFFIKPSTIKRKGGGKFCSRECRVASRRGSKAPWMIERNKRPDIRAKMSSSHKGKKPWNKGTHMWENKPHPQLGTHQTEEARRKMSEAKKGKKPWITGKHHSEESKKKNSEANKGKIPWNKGKKGMHFSQKTEFKKGQTSPRKGKKTGKPSPMRGKKTGKPSPMKGKKTGKPAHNKGRKYEEQYGVKKAQQMKETIRKYAIEHSDEYRDRMIKTLQTHGGKTPKTTEIPLKEELIRRGYKEGIDFIPQYRHGRYVFDFAFPKEKLIIECQGTYWHADWRKYSFDKLNDTQKKNVKRDGEKFEYARRMDGGTWHPVNLFEYEIKTNLKQEVDNIEDFLKRKRNAIN
jgi:very-short-patch-repair endonuclease